VRFPPRWLAGRTQRQPSKRPAGKGRKEGREDEAGTSNSQQAPAGPPVPSSSLQILDLEAGGREFARSAPILLAASRWREDWARIRRERGWGRWCRTTPRAWRSPSPPARSSASASSSRRSASAAPPSAAHAQVHATARPGPPECSLLAVAPDARRALLPVAVHLFTRLLASPLADLFPASRSS
jgi:hypothetical protein